MNKNAIHYKNKHHDIFLMPGSYAHELYTEKQFKKLDEHLDGLDKARRALEGK